jgi:hypothetical protein
VVVAAVALLGAILAGCGVAAPQRAASSARAGRLAQVQATHEYPRARPAHEHPSRSATSAVRAIEAFATAYVNWNPATIVADMRSLSAASVGQARSAMALAAADAAQDYELRRGGIANSGTVEAIAPMIGRREGYIVVTRERTTAANPAAYRGLAPSWHVSIATVTAVAPGAWVLSGWQPES